jgi:hypothetical protein
MRKKTSFVGILNVTDEKISIWSWIRILNQVTFKCTDLRIQVHTKMSGIRNTVLHMEQYVLLNSSIRDAVLYLLLLRCKTVG